MEPVEAKIRYVIRTKAKRVEQIKGCWFVQFEGSWESLNFGVEEPQFNPGDKVKITFERISDVKPSQPPIP